MTEARCPASCGELVQGWIQGSEKLVSMPINWFSTVFVTFGQPQYHQERPMMRKALQLTLQYFRADPQLTNGLKIEFDSTIPVAKGFASSTADIAATIMATARCLEQIIEEQDIVQLCAHLEPTDSTAIQPLALFDHQQGKISERLPAAMDIDILILESPIHLETSLYHLMNRRQTLLESSEQMTRAYRTLRSGLYNPSPQAIGEAAVMSAIESQHILRKPHFRCLLDIVEHHQLFGLNVAHSGSAVGMLFDGHAHDIERVINDIQGISANHYPDFHLTQLIAGGVR